MINQKNMQLGKVRSVIRELFEYGKKRKAEIGEEKVYDFSLGNPSVPAPKEVNEALVELIQNSNPVFLHGYTSAQGDASVRGAISDYINLRFATSLCADNIYLTCGAAASLTITLNALLNEGDEVITFAPFFPEYKVFVEHAGGKLIAVQGEEATFQIDLQKLQNAITAKTKAVIINSPNNPSGVVYSEKTIKNLCQALNDYAKKFNTEIYLISDEPYRELVFDKNVKVPYVMNYYKNSVVCYSYSKALSLPGERIGYIAVNNQMQNWQDVYAAICGAGRALGYVCAPNLFQQLIKKVIDKTADVSIYKNNRDILVSALTEYGYTVVKPDGAFYLFVKALEDDADAFCERAKKHELLIVSGNSFGTPGYVRISYCVDTEMIKNSLPAFKALAESYKA
ncbi:MAG: pyridoxal phosphate-dependent aminotransferase [Clostridiales bacterium]|nr:pyridoxal phosphate-dependent aminotransferase [Clostridiales bacterium]